MKNLVVFVLFLLAACGCGVSYLLLRLPDHAFTALIVRYLAGRPDEPPASDAGPAATPAPVAAAATEPASASGRASCDKAASVPASVPETDPGKDWKGLVAGNWYAGKRLSESDFRGKVALVYVWNSAEKPSVAMLGRIEELWKSFKHKPLVVLGSHRGGRNAKIPKAYRQLGLSFPMYEDAGFRKEPSVSAYPFLYVIDHHGAVVFRGRDDRSATEALVAAMTAAQLKQ